MYINYINGSRYYLEDDDEVRAMEIIEEDYPDAVYGEWELRGYNDTKPIYRRLVWENEEIAGEPGTGDDGSHAIAEIVRD